MPTLSAKAVREQLKTVPAWARRAHVIRRTFKFAGFLDGIAFVRRVAQVAQKANHHPDMDIRFNQVTLKLTSHDQGGLTQKDFSLARECDGVFAKSFEQ